MNAILLRVLPFSLLIALAAACGGESGSDQQNVEPQDAAAEILPESGAMDSQAQEAADDAQPDAALDCIAAFTSDISPVIDGLLYMSESDYPFEIVSYPDAGTGEITPAHVLELLKLPADTVVEQRTLAQFFSDYLMTGPDGAKYAQMRQVLEKHLTNLTVIRAGKIQVHVMLVGRTKCGQIAGLTTVSIET